MAGTDPQATYKSSMPGVPFPGRLGRGSRSVSHRHAAWATQVSGPAFAVFNPRASVKTFYGILRGVSMLTAEK